MEPPNDPSPAESTLALIERHRAGDPSALQVLVERYYPRVERIVRVRLGPTLLARETVADVVQDVFLRIVEGLEGYERRVGARWIDWVARLAQNEISNHVRRDRAQKRGGALRHEVWKNTELASAFDFPADSTGVSTKATRREEAEIVDRCLSELSEPHREVILLRDYAGADWRTIAEGLGRPSPEACQELHRRARVDLARRLQGRL